MLVKVEIGQVWKSYADNIYKVNRIEAGTASAILIAGNRYATDSFILSLFFK